jgi:hypothetical protein
LLSNHPKTLKIKAQYFPGNMGYPVGGPGKSKYFFIQWHLENTDRDVGVKEDAGVRMFFTENYREIEFGIFSVNFNIYIHSN